MPESSSVSEVFFVPMFEVRKLKPIKPSEQYNIPLNQDRGLNEPNFIKWSQIPEEEHIKIIQTGLQLKNEGKISLTDYYESIDPNSLFQLKGYNLKYETTRKLDLFKQLKRDFTRKED